MINSNFGHILHRFRDIAAQRSKNRFFALPTLLWGPRQNFSMELILQKLEGWGYCMWKLHNPNFKRFWPSHPCDRQTDRRTDGRTDGIAMAYTRYSTYAVACKNETNYCWSLMTYWKLSVNHAASSACWLRCFTAVCNGMTASSSDAALATFVCHAIKHI